MSGGSLTTVWNTDSSESIQVRNADNEHDTLAGVCFMNFHQQQTQQRMIYTRVLTGTNFFSFESAKGGAIVLEEIAQ